MDTASTPGPTNAEKQRFLNKIQEWRELGFEVDELEDLLESDFDEFLRRRLKILKGQVELEKGDETLTEGVSETRERFSTKESESPSLSLDLPPDVPTRLSAKADTIDVPIDIEPEFHDSKDDEDDDILLVGEPIPPEDNLDVEDVDEAVIVVGKQRGTPKSKIHRTQQEAMKTEKGVEKPKPNKELETDDADGSEVYSYDHLDDEVEYEEEESSEESYDETSEEVEFNIVDEDEYKSRKTQRERPYKNDEEGERKGVKTFGAIVVVILIIFTVFYYFWIDPMMVQSDDEKVTADFEITPVQDQFEPGIIITFDASSSKGKGLEYSWDMDDDFIPTEGSLQSKIVRGYFTSNENVIREKTITLKVSGKSNKDSVEQIISIHPSSFTISEEKIGDRGEFKVDGGLDITNPDGIVKMDFDENDITGTFYVKNINIVFKTLLSKPMTLELKNSIDIRDGFQQLHSVYERNIVQDLDLSGSVSGTADIESSPASSIIGGNSVPLHADIDGTMQTSDRSFTDFETANTIYSRAKNDVEITISPEYSSYPLGDYSFSSNDLIESYPDLQNNPRNLRLIDLTKDELEIGDQSGITTGNVIYTWNAQKVEYIYNRPAIKVNISIDDYTKIDNNIEEFFLAFWIAEDISQPVKTQIHSVQEFGDNTTTFNYISIMTEFYSGRDLISNQSCNYGTGSGHYFAKNPGYDYIPGYNWSFLSQTGSSKIPDRTTTSFDGFTPEQAIAKLQSEQAFQDYLNTHSECYVVSGYCTATGEQKGSVPQGALSWNLTFGSKNSSGLNAIIPLNGDVTIERINIKIPTNSTEDFSPLLTFSSSEDILLNTSNQDILDLIFDSNSKVDFSKVKYGIETNLEYPNMEITSIMFTEHSKYSYVVSYNDESGERQRMINVALDGETGQILYYWDHTDDGLSIF